MNIIFMLHFFLLTKPNVIYFWRSWGSIRNLDAGGSSRIVSGSGSNSRRSSSVDVVSEVLTRSLRSEHEFQLNADFLQTLWWLFIFQEEKVQVNQTPTEHETECTGKWAGVEGFCDPATLWQCLNICAELPVELEQRSLQLLQHYFHSKTKQQMLFNTLKYIFACPQA